MKVGQKRNHGFTLIEIIIYVAILAIILFFIAGFIFNGVNSSSKIQAWQEVNDNGRFITNKILESVQSSQGVN
jgi:prepilin-type N-terminal cleavage/methylation domain-containing protein